MRSRAYVIEGKTTHTVTPYKNIPLKAVLDKYNIVLNGEDVISHDIDKPITPLERVKITRVKKGRKKLIVYIPFRVIWSRKYDLNLRKIELQKGVEKSITRTVDEIFHDGVLHSDNIVYEKTSSKEYYRLVLFDSKNKIEKIYDLSKAKRMKMVATAYYPGDPLAWKDGTMTFLGHKMRRGIVAVDPRIIPLKTRLFIPGYGYAYAGDIGGLIKGKRIDLGVNNVREEAAWMFKDVIVYVLGKSEKY